MKKNYIVEVSACGLSYRVECKNLLSARLFQLSHVLRNTGYNTKVVEA